MATTRKTPAKTKTTAKPKVETEVMVEAPVETVSVSEPEKAEDAACESCVIPATPKEYTDRDMIPCLSITPGEYLFVGDKSGDLYSWLSDGDTVPMRYDDLVAAIRMKRPCIYKPRVIIKDEDILAKYPELQDLYDRLYTKEDLAKILSLTPAQMRSVIKGLPDGAKDAVKALAMTNIQNGKLDSVQRIRALDEIFGTDMLLQLTQ